MPEDHMNGGRMPSEEEAERGKEPQSRHLGQGEVELPGLTNDHMAASEQAAKVAAGEVTDDLAQAEVVFDREIKKILGVTLRGLMVSTNVAPDVLWRSIMRVNAQLIAESMAGELASVFRVRDTIRQAFLKALKGQPVKPAAPHATMPSGPSEPVRRFKQ